MRTQRHIKLAIVVLVSSLTAHPAAAQATGRIQVGAGSATDERGVRSNALTLAPSVVFGEGQQATATLTGSATMFQNNAWSLGGALAANSRAPIAGGFGIALSADGGGSRTSYGATFATAEATPTLEWTWNALTLVAGGQAAAGYTAVSSSAPAGPVPVPPPSTTTLVSETRWLYAPVYGARLRLLGDDPNVGAEFAVRLEPMRIGDTLVTDRTVNAAVVAGPVTLAASAGQRTAVNERTTFGSGTMLLDVTHGVTVDVAGGRYPSNRLTGAAGGNFVTVGLSLRVGGRSIGALPAPRGVVPAAAGWTRLTIDAPNAQVVEVAGDWNDWTPVPAERADNGVWYADLRIPPGQYRYAFRIDGHAWRVPKGAVEVDDGFGGEAAYVTVRDVSTSDTSGGGEER